MQNLHVTEARLGAFLTHIDDCHVLVVQALVGTKLLGMERFINVRICEGVILWLFFIKGHLNR